MDELFKIKLDGDVVTIKPSRRDNVGWYYYYVIRDGRPMMEFSVPQELKGESFNFRTGGHKFESYMET